MSKEMSFNDKMVAIQSELKAPKNQMNKFGGYKYRSQEDILEAVKPLLSEHGLGMVIEDTVSEIAGTIVIHASVKVTDGLNTAEAKASAGVDINRKGMDIAQSFGASSSYARKYALNGMFLIDDTKDADATNTHGKTAPKASKSASNGTSTTQGKVTLTEEVMSRMKAAVEGGDTAKVKAALKKYNATPEQLKELGV